MKKAILILSCILALVLVLILTLVIAETAVEKLVENHTMAAAQTAPSEVSLPDPTTAPTVPTTVPTTAPTVPTTEATEPTVETTQAVAISLTEEEKTLLLKLATAERGDSWCPNCMALVMCTVLNRVESERFPSTIRGVIYAEDQFTPAMDGTLETTEPTAACQHALEMVLEGWDESEGALFYEWSKGESWHSQNLTQVTQHCDTRFYK